METDFLAHHGVKGQKWGVRHHQNKDGSLNRSGQKKAKKMKEQYTRFTGKQLRKNPTKKSSIQKPKQKSISEMSDDEIRSKINRIKLEKELRSLSPKQVSKGRAFIDKVTKDIIAPAATDVAKQVVKSKLTDAANRKFGFDDDLKVYTNNKKK
ncbi:putative uncharacterized protein [Ruminococcus sp. CAG:17]|jgi:hypothetical protein|nr:putative uncharacterized protein [Ruminococcus sp. CAG:17]